MNVTALVVLGWLAVGAVAFVAAVLAMASGARNDEAHRGEDVVDLRPLDTRSRQDRDATT